MKKRLLSLLLVVLIVLGALPMSALATGTDGTAAASTVIPINISQIAGTITGLKVEGVEVVDSKMEQGGAYLEQYITVYVAEADKDGTATISFEIADGATVSGPLVTDPATADVTLSGGAGSYKASYVRVGSGAFAKMMHFTITFELGEAGCEHAWTDATCTAPKTCSACGETDGEALGHSYEKGVCTVCGEADPDYVAPASTVIPINISQIAGTITGLKVEGVEVVDSKIEQGGAYLEQYITVYVAEADKDGTATISFEIADGATVSGPLVTNPATADVTLSGGAGSYKASYVKVGSGAFAKMMHFTITFELAAPTNSAPTLIGEDSSIEMKLNEWYDVDMTEYFEDPDGDELTYYVTYDGEKWTSFETTDFRFYPNGQGTQTGTFKAVDPDGLESETFTITAEVEKVPSKVTVNFSVSKGDTEIYTASETDKVMVPTSLTVPYFDLALYGLERYYYNPQCYATADGNIGSGTAGTKESAEGVVTAMHVFIYATEVLYMGIDEADAGTGKSYQDGIFQQSVIWNDQAAGSSFMFLWDHGSNLNYYVDWQYPVGAPGWGSTSDQIALYGGEDIHIHLIESTSAHGSDFAFFTKGELDADAQIDDITVMQGEKAALTAVETIPDYDNFTTEFAAYDGMKVYYIAEDDLTGDLKDWTLAGTTDENGLIALDTEEMEAGVYYVAAEGMYDSTDGTETGVAIVKLTVEPKPTEYAITLTQSETTVNAKNTGTIYNKAYVYFAEAPAFGAVIISDDNTTGRRNYGSDMISSMPYTSSLTTNISTKEAVEEKYGTIEGLDSENKLVQVYEVYTLNNRYQNDKFLYVLVVETPIVRVESVTLNETEKALEGGETLQLEATINPEDASYPTVTWTSSDTDVAEVTSDGKVTAYSTGTAVITATADGVSASCTVTVTGSYPKPTVIYSGSDWPYRGGCISKITVNGIGVKDIFVNGSTYYITVDSELTAEDAAGILDIVTTGNGAWVKVNDVVLDETSYAARTYNVDMKLTEGAATVTVGANTYWNQVTDNYWSYKNFIFSTSGEFETAPVLKSGSSSTVLIAEDDTYELDLSTLFVDISGKGMTYTVAVDGAEAVSADEAYKYVGDVTGTHSLVFTANNTVGDSPVYTVTLKVLPTESVYMVNRETESGGIRFFAFTDDQGNALPDGTTIEFDEETKTFTITQPTDIVLDSKVITYYMPMGTSFFTGSNSVAGATQWAGSIRTQHTNTLNNGKVNTSIYFYDRKPTSLRDNPYETYYFNYQRVLPENYFEYEVSDIPSHGNTYTGYLRKVTITGDNGGVITHQWYDDRTLNVVLSDKTPVDGTVVSDLTVTSGKSGYGPLTLVDGAGSQSVGNYHTTWKDYVWWTINYKIDKVPTLAEGIEAETAATVPCLDTYTLDLAPLFTDADEGDTLTYQVKIGDGAWTSIEGSTYDYVPETAQEYVLAFRATDGFVYSDTYTVNLTATNASTTYDVTVNGMPENAEFYCVTGFDENGYAILGEKLEAELPGSETVIPINISQIAGTITGLKVEGVEVVDSKMEQGGAYLEQYITVYVAEADKDGTATISFEIADGATVSGPLVTDPATADVTLSGGAGSYKASYVRVGSGAFAKMMHFTITFELAESTGSDTETEESENSPYTVKVPTNVTRIALVAGDAVMTADVSAENETNVVDVVKTDFVIETKAGDPADGTVTVGYGDGYMANGDGYTYYLIPGDGYTYKAIPGVEAMESWYTTTYENQTVADAPSTVTLQLDVKSPKTITIDEEAEVKVYYQRGYYVMSEVEPVLVVDNGDGTKTYSYSCTKAQGYACGYMYFATNGDLIDKAGYMMGKSDFTVTWEGDERTGDYRGEYDPTVGQGARGDDSVLVNVNSQMHLVLEEGETFRLRSSRIWEIINTDTENVMIEPQYIYTGYDESIISMKSANEVLTTQDCGTGGNNWMDITVEGKGVTFLEVGYEAIHLVDGYEAGAWGGAGSANSNDTFNAIDPARTALIVVQTDGKAATDVAFGIKCLSSNVSGNYYEAAMAVDWDAEFDTVYFTGDCGQITMNPSVSESTISEVAVSYDKGETWTALTGEKGIYEVDIYSGNNIIRVTKADGTTAYQVVRGDKITYDITLVTDVDADGEVDAGDTVRVTLNGLHNPIGKMSGIYNPGFAQGQRVTYTWNGENAQQSGYYQYDFVSNAWIEVTIPEDADGVYSLTDGYINFNVFGDGPGNHRNLTDGGRGINTSAASSKYTRSLLPEIVVYSTQPDYLLGDVNGDGKINAVDAALTYKYVNNKTELTEEQLLAADVNGDGKVNAVDAALIYKYVNNKLDVFPAEQ